MTLEPDKPKYSICMCNYNMANTLNIALRSILDQIDNEFEVVLVDDGSSDNSVAVIEALQKSYSNLRLIKLKRDPARQLGFTRNASIEQARGEYVLLHLDCDDITAPHIKDFTKIYLQLEKALQKDFVLSGRPIQMGKKDFMLRHGPYRNIHRGEDRDMWGRLAAVGGVIFLDHQSLKTVLPKTRMKKIYRALYYTFDHLRNDFRSGLSLGEFLKYEIKQEFNFKTKIIRWVMIGPAWVSALIKGPLLKALTVESFEEFARYRSENRGAFDEMMKKYKAAPDWNLLSFGAKDYF